MDCKDALDSKELEILVPSWIKDNGMRILSVESMDITDWFKEVQMVENTSHALPQNVRTGWNKEVFEGFYGYITYSSGSMFTYGKYRLRLYYKKNEINIIYMAFWNVKTREACIYKTFVQDAFPTKPFRTILH